MIECPFNVGDRVLCIRGAGLEELFTGERYNIEKVIRSHSIPSGTPQYYVKLLGIAGLYYTSRFELTSQKYSPTQTGDTDDDI